MDRKLKGKLAIGATAPILFAGTLGYNAAGNATPSTTGHHRRGHARHADPHADQRGRRPVLRVPLVRKMLIGTWTIERSAIGVTMRTWLVLGALLLAGCANAPAGSEPATGAPTTDASPEDARAFGDARTIFRPPAPWYVEGVTYEGDVAYMGTALGAANSFAPTQNFGEPSRIYVVNVTSGELLETILVEGEDATKVHGITGLDMDGQGRLYAGTIEQRGVLRFTRSASGWTQETYVTLPDLPPCLPISTAPCSPTPDDEAALANDMTWDAEGNLYVTDSWQATIWRVPPGPGEPEIWYQHASLDRTFGPNGIRLSPEGDAIYLAVCCLDTFRIGPLVDRASRIVTIPFPDPGTAAPTDFAIFGDGEGADGIAFGEGGDLYVASNAGTKIIVLAPDGSVARTITNDDLSGDGAFDFPASLVFRERSLLVANYGWTNAAPPVDAGRSLVEVYVDDAGFPELRPDLP